MGERARGFIEGEGSATPSIIVAEVSRRCLKEGEAGKETVDQRRRHLEFIRSSSQILDLTFDMAANAGEIDLEMKRKVKGWGLLDSIV